MRFYHFVSQAELTIDGIDDNEEMTMTDVSLNESATTKPTHNGSGTFAQLHRPL